MRKHNNAFVWYRSMLKTIPGLERIAAINFSRVRNWIFVYLLHPRESAIFTWRLHVWTILCACDFFVLLKLLILVGQFSYYQINKSVEVAVGQLAISTDEMMTSGVNKSRQSLGKRRIKTPPFKWTVDLGQIADRSWIILTKDRAAKCALFFLFIVLSAQSCGSLKKSWPRQRIASSNFGFHPWIFDYFLLILIFETAKPNI